MSSSRTLIHHENLLFVKKKYIYQISETDTSFPAELPYVKVIFAIIIEQNMKKRVCKF